MENSATDNAPWQFRWQRPKLVATAKNEKDPLLDGMFTIDSKTARLTAFEARTILDSLDQSRLPVDLQKKINEGNDQRKEFDMNWEDLEESSDEGKESDYDDKQEMPAPDDGENRSGCDCILSVRILISRESVRFMEYLKQNNVKNIDQHVTADVVYVEIVRDSIHMKDGRDDLRRSSIESHKESHTVLFRKLLQWPTSALTYVHNDVSLTQFQESLSMRWHSIIKPFIHNENYQDWQKNKKTQWDSNVLKRRVGLASFCLCRKKMKNEIDSHTIDQDDINEIISRMSFGTFDQFNTTNNLVAGEDLKSDAHSTTPDVDDQKELLLCCITNDGQVHMFSMLDLLVHRVEKYSDDSSKNLFQHFNDKNGDQHFDFGFERFLFGSKIQAKLQEDLFPLSRPKVSISLSIFSRIIQNEEDEISNPEKEDQVKQNLMSLSLLDANIDPTSIQHRTTNNIPTICISSGEYVIIGGMGKRISREQEHHCGGFVTFISLEHLSETRTIFFPFVPTNLSSLIWNEMKLVMIMSETSNQCFAIRTDTTTYVSLKSESHAMFSHHDQVQEHQFKPIMKFSMMEIVIDDYSSGALPNGRFVEKDQKKGLRPLSVAATSGSPSVVCCSIDNSCVTLTLHQMDGLQVKQFRVDESNIPKDAFQQNISVECTLQRHYYVRIPVSDESMGKNEDDTVNVVSCLSGKVRFQLFQFRFQRVYIQNFWFIYLQKRGGHFLELRRLTNCTYTTYLGMVQQKNHSGNY